jgi:hypothetical protein
MVKTAKKTVNWLYGKFSKKPNKTFFNRTYVIDPCINLSNTVFTIYYKKYIAYLKSIELIEDAFTKQLAQHDTNYYKKNNIILRPGECAFDYNVPLLIKSIHTKPNFVLHYSQFAETRLINLKCFYSNIIHFDAIDIFQKHKLYFITHEYFPEICKKYMKPTFYILYTHKYKFDTNYYILRSIYTTSHDDDDMMFITNKKDLEIALEYYESHQNVLNKRATYFNNRILASEVMMNPLLHNGRKVSVHMYYLVTIIDFQLKCFLYNEGKIFLAKKKFSKRKRDLTKDVHNTTYESTQCDLVFPYDLNNKVAEDSVFQQMKIVLSAVTTNVNMIKHYALYNTQNNGFMLTGVNFLIDENYNVFIVNITKQFEVRSYNPRNQLIDKLFNWIRICALDPGFKGTDASTHPSYIVPYPIKP